MMNELPLQVWARAYPAPHPPGTLPSRHLTHIGCIGFGLVWAVTSPSRHLPLPAPQTHLVPQRPGDVVERGAHRGVCGAQHAALDGQGLAEGLRDSSMKEGGGRDGAGWVAVGWVEPEHTQHAIIAYTSSGGRLSAPDG